MAEDQQSNLNKILGVMQQKIGNLELTLNSLLAVLDEKGTISREELNEKAQDIVQEIKKQQEEMQEKADQEKGEE